MSIHVIHCALLTGAPNFMLFFTCTHAWSQVGGGPGRWFLCTPTTPALPIWCPCVLGTVPVLSTPRPPPRMIVVCGQYHVPWRFFLAERAIEGRFPPPSWISFLMQLFVI